MANRKRSNRNEIYLTDEEQFIFEEKFKLSGLKNKSAFLRQLILYGFVYDVDYSYLRAYNVELGRISAVLNQIAARVNSTNQIYEDDMILIRSIFIIISCFVRPTISIMTNIMTAKRPITAFEI